MAVSKRLRFEILRRDNHTCRYCGATAPHATITIDHVTPVALGGTDDPDNLVAACADCNAGKGSVQPDRPLVDDVASDALRWASAMQAAAAAQQAERDADALRFEHFDEFWLTWTTYGDNVIPRPGNWTDSIESFYAAGATQSDIEYAIGVAMRSKATPAATWRYFCGVMWRIISDRQDIARAMLAVEDTDEGNV